MDGNGVSSPTARPVPPTDDRRWKLVDARMRRTRLPARCPHRDASHGPGFVGFLDRATLEYVSAIRCACPRARCTASRPSTRTSCWSPRATHTCIVCMGTACYINGRQQDPRRHHGHHSGSGQDDQRWPRAVRCCRPLRRSLQHRSGRRHRRPSARPAEPRRRGATGHAASDRHRRSGRAARAPAERRPRSHGLRPAGEVRASVNVCEAAGCLSLGSDRLVDALGRAGGPTLARRCRRPASRLPRSMRERSARRRSRARSTVRSV